MKDIQCPHCGYEQDVNTDDGMDEGIHEQECESCEKEFNYSTIIILHYSVIKNQLENEPGKIVWE